LTTISRSILSTNATATLALAINRGLEVLWLLAVFLTPLAFLGQDYAISEASIGYVEVPKIALLRTLAGLIAMLWLIEWGINSPLTGGGPRFEPRKWLARLFGWVCERPTRWLLLAAGFFFGTTLLSTVLSGSRDVSLWGEVPGQDGYPAYTVTAYLVLFSVIATHLKAKAQLWRLMGAIVAMGTLVSGYAIFQHYGHDFLDLIEETGGGASEVSVFMGNSLFAGAALMMVIPMTLVAAVHFAGEPRWASGWSWSRLRPFLLSLAVPGFWSAVLTVQLLGITFTFARGPWVGMIATLVGVLGLVTLFVGWRSLVRAAMILGLTVALGVAVLHGLGSISILGIGPWLSVIIVLAGFLPLALVQVDWGVFGRVVVGVGLAVTLAVVVVLAMSWFRSDDPTGELDSGSSVATGVSTAGAVADRLTSIKEDVLSGFAGGRRTHWKVSWTLFRDHPWPEFDSLNLRPLRHLIGYGPDLFRYTYLLESAPEGPDLLSREPDHAHNFFIHQTVEQGVFGLFSSLGIFVTVFIVGGYLLLRDRQGYSLAHKLILIGLLATLAGRFLEMMVGVARVSDLTVLWVLLALFAALPQVMGEPKAVPQPESPLPTRRRRSGGSSFQTRVFNWRLVGRFAIVAWLIGSIFVLTWVKSVNNVRAAVNVGDAVRHVERGDFQAGLAGLDRAIDLAPDVSVYYNYKALVYSAYQKRTDLTPAKECSAGQNQGYLECLAFLSYWTNREGKEKRPFSYRAHMAVAASAHTLGTAGATITPADTTSSNSNTIVLVDETVRLYQETLALVPGSPVIRNGLADAYLLAGQPEAAHTVLEESLAITGENVESALAYLVQAKAYQVLGEAEMAIESLEQYTRLIPSGASSAFYTRILVDIVPGLGQSQLAADILRRVGVAYYYVGVLKKSAEYFEQSALMYLDLGQGDLAIGPLHSFGQALHKQGSFEQLAQALLRTCLACEEPELIERNSKSAGEESALENLAQDLEFNLERVGDGMEALKTHNILAGIYSSLGRTGLAAVHREMAQQLP
jgi:tetratricopeptide (TPR) repeat protein